VTLSCDNTTSQILPPSLTERVRARSLAGFTELVAELGGDGLQLLGEVGLPATLLADPDASFEHQKLMQLLELTAERLRAPDFGLRLAHRQGIAVLGPVALLAQHAATVGDALAAISNNMLYHSPGAEVRLLHSGWPASALPPGDTQWACLCYRADLGDDGEYRHNVELSYTIAVEFLRLISQQPSGQWRLNFAHQAALPLPDYRAHLGCRVYFGQPFAGLFFPAALLQQPIQGDQRSSGALAATAERFVAHMLRRQPLNITAQVEALVKQQLSSGRCTLPVIARQLSMSPRSLQRRLVNHGVAFREIVDALRRELAERLLCQSELSLMQVCVALGYSEASTFNRACQRWFGTTPLRLRRARLSPSTARRC
jgi:AraC-like DNA-binding protein